ncbi:MAG: peptide ABC transporter substrate-binding protein [Planctomycetota bacterium]
MLKNCVLWTCLAAIALTTAGCGFQSEEPQSEGSELRFISGAPIDTLDPQGTSWLVDFRVIEGLFEPLLRVNPETLELEPAAAEAMPDVSADGLAYTFRLRHDAKWSNGQPVRASDYVYGWSRALLPDLAADYAGLFFCIDGAEDYFNWRSEQLAGFAGSDRSAQDLWQDAQRRFAQTVGLEVIDERTIRVRLREPTAYFNELVAFAAFMPIHENSAMLFMDLDTDTGLWTMRSAYFSDPANLVSNGPYRLTEWTFKRRMILDQNPHYWNKDAMGNTRVVMEVNSDEGNALLNYAQGQYDWFPNLSTSSAQAPDLVNSQRDDVHVGPAAGTVFYLFNCRPTLDNGQPNPMADARVRQAFAMAVDRDLIVTSITRLNEPTATTMTPVGAIPGYDPPTDTAPAFNPSAARKLLAEAGYPDGQGLTGLSILYNTEAPHEKLAAALAKMWQTHLGVTVQLEGVEKSRFRQRRKNGGFTISRGGWYGDYRDPTTFLDLFRSNDGNNDAAYQNPAYDQLLRDAAAEVEPAARFALLRDAEAVMLADAPIVPLHQPINLELFDPAKVTNLYPNAWNYRRLDAIAVAPDPAVEGEAGAATP